VWRRPLQEVYEKAAETNGIAYQGAAYEGLTVDFLELAFAAGGTSLSDDVNDALSGTVSPEDALKQAQTEMEQALQRARRCGRWS
jgi:ABC-type glycerol-3-phosphate transport system substrate-binding protein